MSTGDAEGLRFRINSPKVVCILRGDRTIFCCRTRDVVTAEAVRDEESGWIAVLVIVRDNRPYMEAVIPCADDHEAGTVVDYLTSKMVEDA